MPSFYPKHLKRRRQRENEQIIARAVLAGLVMIKRVAGAYHKTVFWEVHWPDGKIGHFSRRTIPALMFLFMKEHGGDWLRAWSRYRG